MFTQETTSGYTDEQLDTLNREWLEIVWNENLEPHTDEYSDREKQFADDVSHRTEPMTKQYNITGDRFNPANRIEGHEADHETLAVVFAADRARAWQMPVELFDCETETTIAVIDTNGDVDYR